MQQPLTTARNLELARLNPLALALGFGVAGLVGIALFGAAMSSMWGMSGTGGWMHSAVGGGVVSGGWTMGSPGNNGASMMGGGWGFFAYALFWGFFGAAIAGGVTASVYNTFIRRSASVADDRALLDASP